MTYRVDNPGGTVPGGSVDGSPQVEEEDGGDTAAVQVGDVVLGRLDDVDVGTDDPHADGASDGTNEQQLSATELVNKEEQPDDGHEGLDDTENTSQDVNSVRLDTEGLEDGRRVVVDGVDTGSVLPEEEHAAQEQTVAEKRTVLESLEGLEEAHADGGLLLLVSLVDSSNLLGDVDITGGQLADPAQVVHGLGTVLVEE